MFKVGIMKKMLFRSIGGLAILLIVSATTVPAAYAMVVNGSLTGPVATDGLPSGWTAFGGTPDTNDVNNNVGTNVAFVVDPAGPSPDGGTWVGLARDDSISLSEIIGQQVTGFVAGQTYVVSWYAGNFGGFDFVNPASIDVLIDSASIGSGTQLALGSDWFSQSVTFTATDTFHDLRIGLLGTGPSYLSIDGIAVTAVPIPAAIWLFGSGLVGLVGLTRRKHTA